ncbi:MAG: dihydrofolate reductase [Patescibacteria group bacterium]|jgi:dihydrofolate reductase
MLTLIAAVAKNNVIGKNNELPWHLPEDLKHFKTLTTGNTVLMGRKTFESIVTRLGKPLPDRKNIVITRQENYPAPEGILIYRDIETALKNHSGEQVFVIGGAEMYRQTIERADRLEITHVDQEVEGDATFPSIDLNIWKKASEESHDGYSFATYMK